MAVNPTLQRAPVNYCAQNIYDHICEGLVQSETETTTCVLGALFFFFHDFQQRVKLKENCQPGKAEWERRLFDGKVAGGVVAL